MKTVLSLRSVHQRGRGHCRGAALADILVEGERTGRLIEDLLIMARADSGAAQLVMEPLDLSEPLLKACEQGAALAESKGHRFTWNVPQSPATMVLGDRDAIRRLFFILIDNAVKYTPPGGHIEVQVEAIRRDARVVVRDSGIGIAPEDLEHIFERFYRADKARQRDSGGTGLGLSIGQWIASMHHADVRVESELGRGAAFSVTFPALA
jgi:signal transduction histidine kinase